MSDGISDAYKGVIDYGICKDCGKAFNGLSNSKNLCNCTNKLFRRAVLDKIVEESQEMGLYDEPEDTRTEEEIRAQDGVHKRNPNHIITGKLELTEGTKYDSGKPTTALLPSQPLLEIAKVLDYGAKKYAPHNWSKGIKYSRVLSAAQRHMLAWNEGESVDPETGISHLAHAACNLLFLLDYESRNMVDFDDRRKK